MAVRSAFSSSPIAFTSASTFRNAVPIAHGSGVAAVTAARSASRSVFSVAWSASSLGPGGLEERLDVGLLDVGQVDDARQRR